MKLRDALKKTNWEAFMCDGEVWNTTDLLNTIQPGESPQWLDAECKIWGDEIIDNAGNTIKQCN